MNSTNMLKRFNEEIKRRAIILGLLPNEERCLGLTRGFAVDIRKLTRGSHDLNMNSISAMREAELRQAA
jgi:putative transposase